MNGKRSRYDISAEILKVARDEDGALKSHIVYRANLNFNFAKQYLEELIRLEMLEESRVGKRVFRTTEKGIDFINRVEGLQDSMTGGV